ncbi:hypothetical protein EVAR_65674_1 [Eumeta japonica]|uniref:Uncharacterized protein n=1 Tax=Eumeta variegata TaxID=151549 RepID=A0A4C1ZMS0_EUMVA|nr:hypothetical protein EVAR_65674_1 [Eumeta japonica]
MGNTQVNFLELRVPMGVEPFRTWQKTTNETYGNKTQDGDDDIVVERNDVGKQRQERDSKALQDTPHSIHDRTYIEMLHLFARPAGRVDRMLQDCRQFKMLYFECGLEAKVHIGMSQPRSDISTLNKAVSVPYKVGGDDPV